MKENSAIDSEHAIAEASLFAYEVEMPCIRSYEEIMAEKFMALRHFDFSIPVSPAADLSGAATYTCRFQAIQKRKDLPPFILQTGVPRDLRRCDGVLDLSYAGLGTQGCLALADALRVNTSARKLVLVGNHITPFAAQAIVQAIIECRNVTMVDLSVNRLGAVEILPNVKAPFVRGGFVVNELISPGSIIHELSLRDNQLTDGDLALFSDTLSESIMLLSLDLSYNRLGYLGAIELARVLSCNGDLRELNLEWNNFGPAGCHLLAQGLLLNNTIKSLNLSACGVDNACVQLIGRIMSENVTEEIIIANNRITAAGTEALAKGLLATSSLVTLVMDGNLLGDEGCNHLINVAVSGDAKTLRLLSLQHCGCSFATESRVQEASADEGLCIRISEGFSVNKTPQM